MNTSVYTPCDELKTNILEKAGAEQVRGYPLTTLAYEGGVKGQANANMVVQIENTKQNINKGKKTPWEI